MRPLKRSLPWLLPFVAALVFHGPQLWNGFVNLDDPVYFTANPHVLRGLTLENLQWAFGIHPPSMWIPLTWLSHQAMVELLGTAPAPHLGLNLLLHAANCALIALWLKRAAGRPVLALLVGLLLAVHPIHVESVAWLTERKDVLCLFFCAITLLAHERRVRTGSRVWTFAVVAAHTLAVMAKPLAVTLPCLLLVLEHLLYREEKRAHLLAETTLMLGVSAAGSALTVLCQRATGAIGSLETFPISDRFANATLSVGTYLRRLIAPFDLAAYHPYPKAFPTAEVALAATLILLCSLLAWRLRLRVPQVLAGWLWFLGTLVPMSGLLQAGGAAMADRYAYLPFIGLYLALVWLAAEFLKDRPQLRTVAHIATSLALAALAVQTWHQTRLWRSSETLFAATLLRTGPNALARNNLGLALEERGDLAAARWHYEQALAADPRFPEALGNLAVMEAKSGRLEVAERLLRQALALNSANGSAWHNLGKLLVARGDPLGAMDALKQAIRFAPSMDLPRYELGTLHLSLGAFSDARDEFAQLVQLYPRHADGWVNLGFAHYKLGESSAAETSYLRAVTLGSPQAATNLAALLLEQHRDTRLHELALAQPRPDLVRAGAKAHLQRSEPLKAERLLRHALALEENVEDHILLGVALGLQNRHAEALDEFETALRLAPDHPDAARNRDHALKMLGK